MKLFDHLMEHSSFKENHIKYQIPVKAQLENVCFNLMCVLHILMCVCVCVCLFVCVRAGEAQ